LAAAASVIFFLWRRRQFSLKMVAELPPSPPQVPQNCHEPLSGFPELKRFNAGGWKPSG
jgi:hypothetical protein